MPSGLAQPYHHTTPLRDSTGIRLGANKRAICPTSVDGETLLRTRRVETWSPAKRIVLAIGPTMVVEIIALALLVLLHWFTPSVG